MTSRTGYEDDPVIARLYTVFSQLGAPIDGDPTSEWAELAGFNVYIENWIANEAKADAVLLHGGGGHGRLLAPVASALRKRGFDCHVPDLPGFGLTVAKDKRAIVYDDWRRVAAAIVRRFKRDDKVLVIVGFSMGGMLAYDACAETGLPGALIGTCFLDPTSRQVRKHLTRFPLLHHAPPSLTAFMPPFINRTLMPMRWIAPLDEIANEPNLTQAIVADKRAGGNAMPLGFLLSFARSEPIRPPSAFDVCPVVLAQPTEDRWTPLDLSLPFFEALTGDKKLVMLEGAGHAPFEAPGRDQLIECIVRSVSPATS